MVPLFAGVVIAGLGIGALLSAFVTRHTPTPVGGHSPLVVMHTPTPILAATQRPAPTATPTSVHTVTPAPTATARASATATAAATATATVAKTATPQPSPPPTPAPARVAQTATAPPVQSVSPAESLVRRYLEALAHGDDATARGALGGGSASSEEIQYLDPSMRITSLSTSHGASGVSEVQVELRTAKGQYFGTFAVDPSATRITQHELIPVAGTTAR